MKERTIFELCETVNVIRIPTTDKRDRDEVSSLAAARPQYRTGGLHAVYLFRIQEIVFYDNHIQIWFIFGLKQGGFSIWQANVLSDYETGSE